VNRSWATLLDDAQVAGIYQVTASLPVDVMGVYVLVPNQVES
jgi:hypothetical protein